MSLLSVTEVALNDLLTYSLQILSWHVTQSVQRKILIYCDVFVCAFLRWSSTLTLKSLRV